MDPSGVSTIAELLKATGPYGALSLMGWVLWRVTERKDRELKLLGQKIISMSESQTAVITKVETALVALKKAIEDLSQKHP